jgi:hypothetical protein
MESLRGAGSSNVVRLGPGVWSDPTPAVTPLPSAAPLTDAQPPSLFAALLRALCKHLHPCLGLPLSPCSALQVVRNFLLQGPHPGSSTPEIVSFLKPLLQEGVTTFVCLQAELPSSATSAQGSRSATYGSGGSASAKPYFEGALAMVRAGGYPMSATPERLSFVHYPMSAAPGFVPEAEYLKKVVRVGGWAGGWGWAAAAASQFCVRLLARSSPTL